MKNSFPLSVGLTLGLMVGLVHVVWSILVAAGAAQAWVDLIARLHFMDTPVRVHAFDLGSAVLLVIITSLIGFIVGSVAGAIWVKVRKS